jgi:hypothetical protein
LHFWPHLELVSVVVRLAAPLRHQDDPQTTLVSPR